MSLVIVGSVALDTVETKAGKITDALGGSSVYASIAASYLTTPYVVGVVGSDYPSAGRALMEEHGVKLDGLQTVEGKTFRWSGRYEDWNRAETILTELNVFADFAPVIPSCCKCCRSLLLANIDPRLQISVLDQIDSYQWVACDTMNYWIKGCRDDLEKVVRRVDIVFMNEAEITQFTGEDNVFAAVDSILEYGVRAVVIKRGEYGSLVVSEGDMIFAPAYPVRQVVDPTGAGDCFAGGFMGYLANCDTIDHATIRQAVFHGTALAALDVSAFSVDGIKGLNAAAIRNRVKDLERWTS
jgi:sugar/nucleoside kinase (ribokinase family)